MTATLAPAPTIEAARYPQVVALAQILWSPALRELPFTPATVSSSVDEVRRTVAPTFTWTATSYYGHYDPQAIRRRARGLPGRIGATKKKSPSLPI